MDTVSAAVITAPKPTDTPESRDRLLWVFILLALVWSLFTRAETERDWLDY